MTHDCNFFFETVCMLLLHSRLFFFCMCVFFGFFPPFFSAFLSLWSCCLHPKPAPPFDTHCVFRVLVVAPQLLTRLSPLRSCLVPESVVGWAVLNVFEGLWVCLFGTFIRVGMIYSSRVNAFALGSESGGLIQNMSVEEV